MRHGINYQVEVAKFDVVVRMAALTRTRQRRGGNVGRDQMADARCELLGEAALGTGQFQRPLDRHVGNKLELPRVLFLFVGAAVVPGVRLLEQLLPVGLSIAVAVDLRALRRANHRRLHRARLPCGASFGGHPASIETVLMTLRGAARPRGAEQCLAHDT